MPPKKRQKASLTIHSHYVDSLPDQRSSSSTSPDKLSPDQLARAYGFAPPRDSAAPEEIDLLRACSPRWNPTAGDPKGKAKATEVVELGDSSDDELMIQDDSTSNSRSTGKKKAKPAAFTPRLCSSDNCANSPKCLNWLGQDKWENSAKAWKEYRKSLGLPREPAVGRAEATPNLGATCYVASFLQVWYRDSRFRAGVYACEPPSNGKLDSSPLFQLQVLFAFFQTSKQAVYDPTPLVNSLELDQTEQQDAQEFSKLFLSLLDHEFQKQGSKQQSNGDNSKLDVGNLVQEQFEGSMVYGTRCDECDHTSARPASFLELEISLTKDCKLENRITQSLKDEKLSGDNQYFCENCNTKRDATRYSELRSLPPVLHFSLLRFTFNLKDFLRAKSQHAISYPLSVDMGLYLPPNPDTGRKDEVWYDLKGVLMHKGVSAHHGHYVAQVYDEDQSKWFLFDDETVTEVEDLNAPLIYDEDDDVVIDEKQKKKIKVASAKKGFTRDAQGQILPKSKDAYMLVYTRRQDPSTSKLETPVPPSSAAKEVENLDFAYQQKVDEWNASKRWNERTGHAKMAFEKLREKIRSVYNNWDVPAEDENAFLVDKTALKRWVESGLKTPTTSKANGKGKVESVDTVVAQTPMQESSDSINEPRSDSTLTGSEGISTISNVALSAPGARKQPASSSASHPTSAQAQHLGRDMPEPELVQSIDNSFIVCQHGLADPAKAEHIKLVSQAAFMTLQDCGVKIEPELSVVNSLCRDCVAGTAAEHYYASSHVAQVRQVIENLDHSGDEDYCFISKPWFTDWKKDKPKMHFTWNGTDPSPAAHPYIDDVVCQHGGLAAENKKREIISIEINLLKAANRLQTIFPDFDPRAMNPKPCDLCIDHLVVDETHMKETKVLQQKEKKIIKSFDGQTRLGSTRLPVSADDMAHYVVPKAWTRQWTAWSHAKKNPPPPRPPPLSNAPFLCMHDLLCVDLPNEVQSAKNITIATQPEWRYLVKAYDAGPEVRIWIDPGETAPRSSPDICLDCLEDRRKNFDKTELWVRTLERDDLDAAGQRRPDSPTSELSSHSLGQQAVNFMRSDPGTRGVRSSVRNANKAGISIRKSLKQISMEKEDKIRDLKLRIEEVTGIAVIAQRIFYNLSELDGNQTVQELGLKGDDTIEVFEVKQDVDLDIASFEDVIPKDGTGDRRRSRKRAREEGFRGTGLTGWDSSIDKNVEENGESSTEHDTNSNGAKRSRSNSHAGPTTTAMDLSGQEPEAFQLPCPECTFLNDPALVACEMCGNTLIE
ncbi:uncharacterized protein JCM15063_000644 [Sporobolomyces koalae]|uniref:uncharacterized protein n=1 Tax=Sporobolomyces koalae TaxID=500713 RepID=UPI00317C83A8